MHRILLILLLLVFHHAATAETVLYGLVTYQNTGERVQAIQVAARGASPAVTKATSDSEGVFRLVFPDKKPGDTVFLSITTRIYDLVNHPRELEVVLPENPGEKQVRLVVCKKGERDRNAIEYYEISTQYLTESYERLQKQLSREVEQLEARIGQAEGNIGQLEEQLAALEQEKNELEQNYQAQLEKAWTLAEDFSRIDLAQADSTYQEAFTLFTGGKISDARAVLSAQSNMELLLQKKEEIAAEEEKLAEMEEALARQRRRLEQEKEELQAGREKEIKKLQLAAHLAGLQLDFTAAENALLSSLSLDSTDAGALSRIASLYSTLNRQADAIPYYQKALQYSRDAAQKAGTWANLGNELRHDGRYGEAETAYEQALALFRQLAESRPGHYQEEAATTLNNMSALYLEWNAGQKAISALTASLGICRALAQENPQHYEPALARTLSNAGNLYTAFNTPEKAEEAYREAMEIRMRLAEETPQRHLEELATLRNSLGNLYWGLKDYEKAEPLFAEALEAYGQLAQDSSGRYDAGLAIIHNNLGNLYRDVQEFDPSEEAFRQALRLYRRLARDNPRRYEPNLASTLNNLANLYADTGRGQAAMEAYTEALGAYRRLSRANAGRFAPGLATTLANLGALHYAAEDFQRAAPAYEEALETYRRLAAAQPGRYEPEAAAIMNNLALLHLNLGEGDKVLAYLSQSRPIYRELAEKTPATYEVELARTLMIEAFVWLQRGAQSKANALMLEARAIAERYPEAPYSAQVFRAFNDFYRETDEPFEQALEKAAPYEKQVAERTAYADKAAPQQEIVRILSEACAAHPDNQLLKNELSDASGELSAYLLFTRQFPEAEQAARRCLELGGDHAWANVPLATSLLYQGRFDEAISIYSFWGDVWYNGERYFREVFLEYIEELEAEGVAHPDTEQAREALKK